MHHREPVFAIGEKQGQRFERVLFVEANQERLLAHRVLELHERLAHVFMGLFVDLLERLVSAFFGGRLTFVDVGADAHEGFERPAFETRGP